MEESDFYGKRFVFPIEVYHLDTFDEKEIEYLCRPDKRKRPGLFPKWFCIKCNRYVLPDGIKHYWRPIKNPLWGMGLFFFFKVSWFTCG